MNLGVPVFPKAQVQSEELQSIVQYVQTGHCCAVVGPSNTGKSTLLRTLCLETVRQQSRIAGTSELPLVFFIDFLGTEASELAFYDEIISAISENLERSRTLDETVVTLRTYRKDMLHSANMLMVRSLFTRGLDTVMRVSGGGVVLVFDEFDDIFQALPSLLLRKLRVLHDKYGGLLRYVTGTSRYLEQLRAEESIYEFRELFVPHMCVLRPLSPSDGMNLGQAVARRYSMVVSDEELEHCLYLSGGHPGLLERLIYVLREQRFDRTSQVDELARQLLEHRLIRKECLRLWNELDSEECDALLLLSQGKANQLDGAQHKALERKGLIDGATIAIFSPLFQSFVETTNKGVYYKQSTEQVWVDGIEISEDLNSKEQRKFIGLLYARGGDICSYEEISRALWDNRYDAVADRGTIQALANRVRDKVDKDKKGYIVTVPGRGYRLKIPGL